MIYDNLERKREKKRKYKAEVSLLREQADQLQLELDSFKEVSRSESQAKARDGPLEVNGENGELLMHVPSFWPVRCRSRRNGRARSGGSDSTVPCGGCATPPLQW